MRLFRSTAARSNTARPTGGQRRPEVTNYRCGPDVTVTCVPCYPPQRHTRSSPSADPANERSSEGHVPLPTFCLLQLDTAALDKRECSTRSSGGLAQSPFTHLFTGYSPPVIQRSMTFFTDVVQ